MRLTRLLYTSRAILELDLAAVRELNTLAQRRNQGDGLSGLLCFAPPYFVQCLEGPRTAVSRTLGRILRDPRHAAVTLVSCREVPERAFPDWSMKLVVPSDLAPDKFRALCRRFGDEPLRPDQLAEDDLLAFLRGLSPAAERAAG